jgi:hypothetical protein
VGRVTLCIFDRATGEPEHLRADVLSLYFTARSAPEGSRPIHVWLDPVETEHDALGLPRATRFAGESAQLSGLGSADGLLSQVIVRGIPFWGVAVHLGATPGARAVIREACVRGCFSQVAEERVRPAAKARASVRMIAAPLATLR